MPSSQRLQEMFQAATPRVQELGFLGEPTTVTTSPGWASLKNHWASAVDMLTQPSGLSRGMPTVAESISLSCSLDTTKCTPLVVGYLSRPVLTGIVFTTRSLTVTFIVWLLALPVLTRLSPTLKWTVRLDTPQVPGAALTPAKPRLMVTRSPAGQNFSGRKWISRSLNQRQAPSTPLEVSTLSRRSTAARSATDWLNQTATGMPTPTVRPSRGMMLVPSTRLGVRVVNELTWRVVMPAWSAAATVTR